ncbi:OmpH family outer membrane protein [Sphingobacterium bovistauri]|uniref:OmpH family outer membrane protein n=1 Tax=Sphingobacterium bovistauri TaxID=2781959 RepID=A0ABS7Z8R6_9SPHI|nr:OmpH family outer membrane protein [Sphingobacterium bovistauri]MCA5006544.1 OmpH family outer membrane protein [Sphingobacterium bovistauri]
MKKIFAILAFLTLSISVTFAQRFAYVDSEYILKHIPEYTSAQKQLDDLTKKWQDQIDTQYAEIEKLYKAYQNDHSLLSEDMRRRREDEIVNKEKQVKDLQHQKFSYGGELENEKTRLFKPIQDKVSKTIQDFAKAQGFDFIVDRGNELTFLYANPTLDKSNDVITKLGYKPNTALQQNK